MRSTILKNMQGRTRYSTNHKLLIFSLFSLAFLGTAYYIIDDRSEVREAYWVSGVIIWYAILGVSIAFVLKKTRNGYLMAGVLSWSTFAFCLADNWYTVFHLSIIATKPNMAMTIRNFIMAGIASLAVLSSHNSFHKIHVNEKK